MGSVVFNEAEARAMLVAAVMRRPAVVYHSTLPKHRASIAQRGLIAGDPARGNWPNRPTPNNGIVAVFATTEPNDWGRTLGRLVARPSAWDVWAIDATGLTLEQDTEFGWWFAWRIRADVPPDRLTLHTKARR